jgi:hypothetical protein
MPATIPLRIPARQFRGGGVARGGAIGRARVRCEHVFVGKSAASGAVMGAMGAQRRAGFAPSAARHQGGSGITASRPC